MTGEQVCGDAVAVRVVDGRLQYAALGNIAGYVIADGRRTGLITYPGIVGHQARTIREVAYPLPPDATVVLHSDGLTERWDLADYPGLAGHAPVLIAATLLRDAGVRRDDASVVVARVPRESG